MPRTPGARNADYHRRRAELLESLRERLARPDAPYPSYRELAQACGVAQTTLRHYFGTRDELIVAVLSAWHETGGEVFGHLAQPSGPFAESIRDVLAFHVEGHRLAVLRQLHRVAFAEGLRSSAIGPHVVDMLLEPAVQAVSARLRAHVARGEMRDCDTRLASFVLLTPVTFAFLQDRDLGGRAETCLDIDALVTMQADEFVTAYATRSSRRSRAGT